MVNKPYFILLVLFKAGTSKETNEETVTSIIDKILVEQDALFKRYELRTHILENIQREKFRKSLFESLFEYSEKNEIKSDPELMPPSQLMPSEYDYLV